MKYAAFFRNLNLGRSHCPSKAQFENAFIAAGAVLASSFLTNGTMVFEPHSDGQSQSVFAGACAMLREACGLKEPGYVRSLEHLTKLVMLDPFAGMERDNVHEYCVSFLPAKGSLSGPLPLESKRRDVSILRCTKSEALSLSLRIGNTPGSPNAFLEKLLDLPVTTRSWNTVVRLVQKHA